MKGSEQYNLLVIRQEIIAGLIRHGSLEMDNHEAAEVRMRNHCACDV